jgi:hypothetical protein
MRKKGARTIRKEVSKKAQNNDAVNTWETIKQTVNE